MDQISIKNRNDSDYIGMNGKFAKYVNNSKYALLWHCVSGLKIECYSEESYQ